MERAAKVAAEDRSRKNDDRFVAAVYHPDYQSLEDSDIEDNQATGESEKILRRHVPEFRSEESKQHLHDMDRGRKQLYTVYESGQSYDLPPKVELPTGLRRWALADGWVERNPDRLPLGIRLNQGPFRGEGSVTRKPEAYGSDPVLPVVAVSGSVAVLAIAANPTTDSTVSSQTRPRPSLFGGQQLFGQDPAASTAPSGSSRQLSRP